tara:strand:- start:658 stop:825 length:168 start_codon:yes stop_codon:yes gene_type:complete
MSCEHEWEVYHAEISSTDKCGNEITVYSRVYLRCGLCGAEAEVSVIGEGNVEVEA